MKHIRLPYPLLLSLSLLLSPSPSCADDLTELKETVARQQEQIDDLLQKMKDRESAAVSMFGWNLGLFGDVNFSTGGRERDHSSFYFHELSIFSTASYGDRLNFLTEIAFEEHGTDVERIWAGYTLSDMLIIRAGKFHTAIGYWNKAYHHGKQLFNTVDRPFFLSFEHDGGVVPVHITGIELEGRKTLGIGSLKYELQLGNGPMIDRDNMLDPNNSSDNNGSKQPVLRVSFKPSAIQGLSAGVFATNFEVDTGTKTGLYESIYGIDMVYAGNNIEFITEGFLFHNPDGDGNAFYGQLAYTYNDWTPYFRFEQLKVQEGDPYFKDLQQNGLRIVDRNQVIVGIKYDLEPARSSLKAQYRRDNGQTGYDVFEAQWAFHF